MPWENLCLVKNITNFCPSIYCSTKFWNSAIKGMRSLKFIWESESLKIKPSVNKKAILTCHVFSSSILGVRETCAWTWKSCEAEKRIFFLSIISYWMCKPPIIYETKYEEIKLWNPIHMA